MEKIRRYIIFILGLLVNSLGVSLVTRANLGTSPISSVPYVLSMNFSLSLGTFTVLFSLFIDLSMALLGFIHPEKYGKKFGCLVLGCLVLGIGVYMEILADVVMLPGEAFVRSIVCRWKREFGTTKVVFDVSMTIGAAVLSLLLAGRLSGVREGTVVAALLVGLIARFIGNMQNINNRLVQWKIQPVKKGKK